MGLFGRKKVEEVVVVNDANYEEFSIPVYFNGDVIGEVLRVKGKEIGGLDHLEFLIRIGLGSGAEGMLLEVIKKQGIHLGNNKQLEKKP